MLYDVIIIGAGPAGLFCGCHLDSDLNCLILERNSRPGIKLLMTGAGQCNVTHDGSIKDFLIHYGNKGKLIRQILYKYNNDALIEYFQKRQLEMIKREDGKVFPQSLQAKDVLSALTDNCKENGVQVQYNSNVIRAVYEENKRIFKIYSTDQQFSTKTLVVATGGCSYPSTGSDGNFFDILKSVNIKINPVKPVLVPIFIEGYVYGDLSGISFEKVKVEVFRNYKKTAENTGDVLFTHKCLSGPGILNISRHVEKGDVLILDYYNKNNKEVVTQELKKKLTDGKLQFNNLIRNYFDLPKRFIDTIFKICHIESDKKSSQVSNKELMKVINKIMSDTLKVSDTGGFETAMATSGGVSLDQVDLKRLSSKKYEQLYFAGEALDVDGDTGGYNLQFAFSSGVFCARSINREQATE